MLAGAVEQNLGRPEAGRFGPRVLHRLQLDPPREVTRPSLYGAQHPISVLADGRDEVDTIFVGPCCESGDILTPAPGDPEALGPRRGPRPAIGDLAVIGGAGAYCAAMSTVNYNSYQQAPEVMLEPDGALRLLRRRETLEEIWRNEV